MKPLSGDAHRHPFFCFARYRGEMRRRKKRRMSEEGRLQLITALVNLIVALVNLLLKATEPR